MFKLLESEDINLMSSKFFLLTLICSDSKENKLLISRNLNLPKLINSYDIQSLPIEQQHEILTYTLELCLKKGVPNQPFHFEPDNSVKKSFKTSEVQQIEDVIHQIEKVTHSYIPNYGEDVIEDFQSISQV